MYENAAQNLGNRAGFGNEIAGKQIAPIRLQLDRLEKNLSELRTVIELIESRTEAVRSGPRPAALASAPPISNGGSSSLAGQLAGANNAACDCISKLQDIIGQLEC